MLRNGYFHAKNFRYFRDCVKQEGKSATETNHNIPGKYDSVFYRRCFFLILVAISGHVQDKMQKYKSSYDNGHFYKILINNEHIINREHRHIHGKQCNDGHQCQISFRVIFIGKLFMRSYFIIIRIQEECFFFFRFFFIFKQNQISFCQYIFLVFLLFMIVKTKVFQILR